MTPPNRFQDENLTLNDFYKETWVVCSSCKKMAIAKVDFDTKTARLFCVNCGFNKQILTVLVPNGTAKMAAHHYFNAVLWLQASFKNEIFWALNGAHLEYLESYISANLREHKNRTRFTLLEKLPKFYHLAKNREELLKIISKLKNK